VLVLGVLLGAVLTYAASGPGEVTMDQDRNTLQVSGNGEIQTDPDRATLRLGVRTTEDTAEEARSQNADATQSVIDALTGLGLTEDQIETTRFTIDQERDFNRETRESRVVGYRATNILEVTTNDTSQAAEIIDTAVANGANDVQRATFTLRDETRESIKGNGAAESRRRRKVRGRRHRVQRQSHPRRPYPRNGRLHRVPTNGG